MSSKTTSATVGFATPDGSNREPPSEQTKVFGGKQRQMPMKPVP